MKINDRTIETPFAYLIAEIGPNHQGSVEMCQRLIEAAHHAGFDAVKLQKRTPELAVPPDQRDVIRDTPWGPMRTIEYRERMEFSREVYEQMAEYARALGMDFFASAWDVPSVEFLEAVGVPVYKVPSARLHDAELLAAIGATGKPVILSTGMSTALDIGHAIGALQAPLDRVALLQCTSGYPVPHDQLCLPVISALREQFGTVVGYSGHEDDLEPSVLAVAKYGAAIVERHITMSRALPGSDHGASLEPVGMKALVNRIRTAEEMDLAPRIKAIQQCELAQMQRLGRKPVQPPPLAPTELPKPASGQSGPLRAYELPAHVANVLTPATTMILDTWTAPNVGEKSLIAVAAASARGWVTIADTGQTVFILDGEILEGPPSEETRATIEKEAKRELPIVVFGVGGGQQLHMIRSITGGPILAYEPDPGILKRFLSIGYSLPGVSVTCDLDEFREMYQHFLQCQSTVTVVRQDPYVKAFPEKFAAFDELVHRLLDAEFITMQTIESRMPEWVSHTLENLPAAVGGRSAMKLDGAFKGVPAFIVGAGPSLEKNIHLLKEAKRKGIIIAIDVVGSALAKHGIEPDFFLTVEAKDISRKVASPAWIDRVPRLWTLACHPKTFRVGSGPLLVWADSNAPYQDMCEQVLGCEGVPLGGSCTTAAMLFAETFGCGPIVLVGNDLVNVQDGSRPNHADGVDVSDLAHRHEEAGTVRPWGLLGPDLRDAPIWRHARVWFEQRAIYMRRNHPEVALLNCTEGGSHVDGWFDITLAQALEGMADRSVDVAQAIAAVPPIERQTVKAWLDGQASILAVAIPHARACAEHGAEVSGLMASQTELLQRASKEDGTPEDKAAAKQYVEAAVNPVLDLRNAAEFGFREGVNECKLVSGWTQKQIRTLSELKKDFGGVAIPPDKVAAMLQQDAAVWGEIAEQSEQLARLLRESADRCGDG